MNNQDNLEVSEAEQLNHWNLRGSSGSGSFCLHAFLEAQLPILEAEIVLKNFQSLLS